MKKTDSKTNELEKTVKSLNQQLSDMQAKYLRALADYQNLEKRTNEKINDIRTHANEDTVKAILPVYTMLGKAREYIKNSGLDLIYKQFESILDSMGVKKLEVIGKEFDPSLMDGIEANAQHDGTVIEELEPGYLMHDRVLLVARVKVGSKKQSGINPASN